MFETNPKAKKVLLTAIIVIALVVWGNFFRSLITEISNNSDDNSSVSENTSNAKADNFNNSYFKGDFADPFMGRTITITPVRIVPKPVKKDSVVKKIVVVPVFRPLPYSMRGVIGNLAVLEKDGKTVFVKEGVQLPDCTIEKIYPDSVLISFSSFHQTLKLSKKK